MVANDAHKLVHVFFQSYSEEVFLPFLKWWMKILTANHEMAVSLFRNYGYTYFVPLFKESLDPKAKSLILQCLYLSERSLCSYYNSRDETDPLAQSDGAQCHFTCHPDLLEAFTRFISKNDLYYRDCLVILKLLDGKKIALLEKKSQVSYNTILDKICDVALSCKAEKMATILYFSISRAMNGSRKEFSRNVFNKFSKIKEAYLQQSRMKRASFELGSDSAFLTEHNLISLFDNVWLYNYPEEDSEKLALASKAMISFLKTLDPITVDIEYSTAVYKIIHLCKIRKRVLPEEFLFFHRLAFSCPAILTSQPAPLSVELFLFFPYLKNPKNFVLALEALGALSRALVKNQALPCTVEIDDYLNPEEQKKIVNIILDLSMPIGSVAWSGCVFICSISSKLRSQVLEQQGYNFDIYHQLQLANLQGKIKKIAPGVLQKLQDAHEQSFWSKILNSRDLFCSVTVLRFFVPFLPYTEIHRVLRFIDSLGLYTEIISLEIPQIFLRLLTLHGPARWVIPKKKVLIQACSKIQFFFKKEYAFFPSDRSALATLTAFNMNTSRAAMEAFCIKLLVREPALIPLENIKFLKIINFLLTTGSYEERKGFIREIFCRNKTLHDFFIKIFDSLTPADFLMCEIVQEKILTICSSAAIFLKDVPYSERCVNWFKTLFKLESLVFEEIYFLHIATLLSAKEQQKIEILAHQEKFIEFFNPNVDVAIVFNIVNALEGIIPDYLRWRAVNKIFNRDNNLFYLQIDYDDILAELAISFFSLLSDEVLALQSYAEGMIFFLLQNLRSAKRSTFFSFLPFLDKVPLSQVMSTVFELCAEPSFCDSFIKPLLIYCFARAEVEHSEITEQQRSFLEAMKISIGRCEIYSYSFLIRKRKALSLIEETKVNISKKWAPELINAKQKKQLLNSIKTIKIQKKKEEDLLATIVQDSGGYSNNSKWELELESIAERISTLGNEIYRLKKMALKTLRRQSFCVNNEDRDVIYGGLEEVCFHIEAVFKPQNFFSEIEKEIQTTSLNAKEAIMLASFNSYKKTFTKIVIPKAEQIRNTATQVKATAENCLLHIDKLECRNIEDFASKFESGMLLNFQELENEISHEEKIFIKYMTAIIASERSYDSEKLKSFQHRIDEQNAKLKAIAKDNEILENKVKELALGAFVAAPKNISIAEGYDEEHSRMIEQILSLKNVLERFRELPPVRSWPSDQIYEWEKIVNYLGEIEKSISQNLHHHRNVEVAKLWKVMGLFGFQVTAREGSHFKISHPIFCDVNETLVYHANKQVALPLVKSCYTKMVIILDKWIHAWTIP